MDMDMDLGEDRGHTQYQATQKSLVFLRLGGQREKVLQSLFYWLTSFSSRARNSVISLSASPHWEEKV
jgi:hypothetical protein